MSTLKKLPSCFLKIVTPHFCKKQKIWYLAKNKHELVHGKNWFIIRGSSGS